jgi:hypothetical protein
VTPLADQSSIFYTGPFWFQVVGYGTFFLGALYAASRLQADGLVKRPSWRYWQVACLCLCLWTLSRLATIALPESSDVGAIIGADGKPILGNPRYEEQRLPDGRVERVSYSSTTEKGDPLAEGARFVPIGGRGEVYYYLQFDVILLLAAGVFALLALHDSKQPDAGSGEAADA